MSTALQTTSTALTVTQRAIAALGFDEKKETELRELAARTTTITAITNKDGYTQVHAGRMALKNQRVEIQNAGKDARDDATKFSKAVIAEEKRLISVISPEEERLQKLQDAHDAAIEAEKQAKIDAEIARVAAIDARVETIRNWPTAYTGKPSSLVEQQVRVANEYIIDEFFEEKADTARAVLEASRAALVGILAERQAHEAEQERIKAERAELEKLRAEQALRDAAERARIAEEERQAKVERDAEAARHAAQLKAQQEEQNRINAARQAELDRIEREKQAEWDRREAELKALRDAEDARLAADRAELERQQEEFRKAQEPDPEPEVIVLQTDPPPARPTMDQILATLCATYSADRETVIEWILSMDLSERKAA